MSWWDLSLPCVYIVLYGPHRIKGMKSFMMMMMGEKRVNVMAFNSITQEFNIQMGFKTAEKGQK